MSWGDIINGPEKDSKQLVREDWSEQERKFKENIPSFVASIEVANPLVQEHEIKNIVSQPKAPEGVANSSRKTEEKPVEKQESPGAFVESSPRVDAPTIPAEAAKPAVAEVTEPAVARPAEPKVSDQARMPEEDWMASPSPKKPTKEKPATAAPSSPTGSSFPDFDINAFNDELEKMRDMIDQVKSFDLSHYVSQIGSFGIHVDLDAHRENPEVIAEAFTKLYGCYTTAHARLMELLPMRHRIDTVVDYLMDVGMAFSQASNKERRTGQVKLALRDLLRVQNEVKEVCESYERTCKHLLAQHDMVSRLFSWHQNYLLPRGIGMKIPSEFSAQTQPQAHEAPRMATPSLPEEAPRDFGDKDFRGLDEMPAKPSMKDKKPGFVDFRTF